MILVKPTYGSGQEKRRAKGGQIEDQRLWSASFVILTPYRTTTRGELSLPSLATWEIELSSYLLPKMLKCHYFLQFLRFKMTRKWMCFLSCHDSSILLEARRYKMALKNCCSPTLWTWIFQIESWDQLFKSQMHHIEERSKRLCIIRSTCVACESNFHNYDYCVEYKHVSRVTGLTKST